MIVVEIEGFGLVREPGQTPYPVFYITVSQPAHAASWTVYRRPAAFRALSDRLREILPGLQPCPSSLVASDQVREDGRREGGWKGMMIFDIYSTLLVLSLIEIVHVLS